MMMNLMGLMKESEVVRTSGNQCTKSNIDYIKVFSGIGFCFLL